MVRRTIGLVFLAALASGAMAGGELPRGRVVERVVCAGNESQSYALYLPAAYSPKRAWPILYCLDPGARGRVPVELFAEAAEQAGWIVAGSNNSHNGPTAPAIEAIGWLVRGTHERLAVDDSQVYVAGFRRQQTLPDGFPLQSVGVKTSPVVGDFNRHAARLTNRS
jgi:hypothetical protein